MKLIKSCTFLKSGRIKIVYMFWIFIQITFFFQLVENIFFAYLYVSKSSENLALSQKKLRYVCMWMCVCMCMFSYDRCLDINHLVLFWSSHFGDTENHFKITEHQIWMIQTNFEWIFVVFGEGLGVSKFLKIYLYTHIVPIKYELMNCIFLYELINEFYIYFSSNNFEAQMRH